MLAGKRVPCVGQFTVGEPLLRMQVAPAKLVRFAFADAGVSFYGNGIIATDNTIATKPEIVRRFVVRHDPRHEGCVRRSRGSG